MTRILCRRVRSKLPALFHAENCRIQIVCMRKLAKSAQEQNLESQRAGSSYKLTFIYQLEFDLKLEAYKHKTLYFMTSYCYKKTSLLESKNDYWALEV